MDRLELERSLNGPILNFVTANHLMLYPKKIKCVKIVDPDRNSGVAFPQSRRYNKELMISWTYIALTEIYPAVKKICRDLDLTIDDLGDLGLGKLGDSVLDLVKGLDMSEDLVGLIRLIKKIDKHTFALRRRVYQHQGYFDWLKHFEKWQNAVECIGYHGIEIHNEYLEYCTIRNSLVFCAQDRRWVFHEDMHRDCKKMGYKYPGCSGCMMKKPENPITDGEIWLQITLPEPKIDQ